MSTPRQPEESSPPNQPASQKQRPCHHWKRGFCRFGDKCKFRHDVTGQGMQEILTGSSREETDNERRTNRTESTRSHATGSDSANATSAGKDKAKNPVSKPDGTSTTATNVYRISNFPVKAVTCRDWKTGNCPRGIRCRFRHANELAHPDIPLSRAETAEGSTRPVDQTTTQTQSGGQKTKRKILKEQSERENQEQARQRAEAERRENEARLARERAEREAHAEEARRIAEVARIGAERQENEARLAREQGERAAQENARLAREKKAREAVLRRIEEVARTEAERQENGARSAREQEARLAREKRAQEEEMRRAAEVATMEAERRENERRENEARLAQEQAERVLARERRAKEEEMRRVAEIARMEAERQENEARLARERAERVAQEKARLAREKRAREEAMRKEHARKAEEERRRKEAERLAREKEAEEAIKRRQIQIQTQRERDAAAVEQYIVLDSSLVTCAAGLDIRHVVTGFDLCKITIKNLPRDAKREEIANIFLQQGVDQSEFFIFQMKPDEAVVLANVEHGQAIALGLEGIEFRNEILSFSVSQNASGNAMDAATRNSPFLVVSWRAPSQTLVATYSTMAEAQEKARTLNRATWSGRQITAVMNERPPGVAGLRNFVPSSVKITGLPRDVLLDADFAAFTGTWNFRTLKSISYDLQSSFATIHQHLSNAPGVQMNSYEILGDGQAADGEAKVKVLFDEWEDAKRSHVSLGKMRDLNSPIFRPWLPPKPLLYSIKISRQQYEAQRRQWDALSEKKPGSDAHVQPKIGDRGDVVFIKVMGQDKKAAGSLKVRVESMVAGERLDSAYWHSSFGSPQGRAFFNRIYNEKKVFVRHDFKTRSLKVCGEPGMVLEVREMIKEEFERLAAREITRTIDRGCIGFFVKEGLEKLKELLGEENVHLNPAARPCKITVKGGEEAIHHLQRLIDEARGAMFLGPALPGLVERDTCPICTDGASNPEQLGCGHTYCAGCLKHFLTSAADTKNFPLVCMGNDATCNAPIAIPFIRRFLPVPIFQGLVEAAFLSYLEQHPQELKYCTTADCKQIYRHRTDQAILQCPSCFSTICPACDEEAHEGMTCAERRLHKNPAEQERLNEELAAASGYKKCPQCKIWIEKTEGCNHMSCRCGAHICWRCMGIFTAETIYDHMNSDHGNIYDEVPADVDLGNAANNVFMAGQRDGLRRIEREREVPLEPYNANIRPQLDRFGAAPYRNWEIGDADQLAEANRQRRALELYNQQVEEHRRQLAENTRRQRAADDRRRIEAERVETAQREQAERQRQWLNRLAEERREQDQRRAAAQRRELLEENTRRAAEVRRRQEEEKGGWCVVM